jgi:hypothetical protein
MTLLEMLFEAATLGEPVDGEPTPFFIETTDVPAVVARWLESEVADKGKYNAEERAVIRYLSREAALASQPKAPDK